MDAAGAIGCWQIIQLRGQGLRQDTSRDYHAGVLVPSVNVPASGPHQVETDEGQKDHRRGEGAAADAAGAILCSRV